MKEVRRFKHAEIEARWEDSLEAYAREYATKWEILAQDREVWPAWESGFVQRAMLKQEGSTT